MGRGALRYGGIGLLVEIAAATIRSREVTSRDVSWRDTIRAVKSFNHDAGVLWVFSVVGSNGNVSVTWAISAVKRRILV
jgi:hypothetical protein